MSMTNITKFRPSILLVFSIYGLFAAGAPAGGKQDKQEMVAALKQSIAHNQAALKQYTWTETTEVSLKGEVKKREEKECHYGPDGTVVKTPIQSDDQAQQQQQQGGGHRRRNGPLKQEIVEHKKAEMKDYMEQVAALVHEYVPPDPHKIQAAVAAGNAALQPLPSQGVTLTFKDYLKPGDSLALGFDPNTKKILNYNVQSYLGDSKDDTVTLAVTFASLPDGTNYAQQSVVNAPKKNIQVKVTNSGYTKTGK